MSDDRNEEQWREKLTPEQFNICRGKGTERAFTGKYWDTKTPGTYRCACCGEVLFDSGTKYDSGSGWPSFYAPVAEAAVRTETDSSHGMVRTEVMCRKCGAHLGHVFPTARAPRDCVTASTRPRWSSRSAAKNDKPRRAPTGTSAAMRYAA